MSKFRLRAHCSQIGVPRNVICASVSPACFILRNRCALSMHPLGCVGQPANGEKRSPRRVFHVWHGALDPWQLSILTHSPRPPQADFPPFNHRFHVAESGRYLSG
ncbi:hypothetical protein Fuma_04146 [Fuerstiella marisgermanici]|uniref:Uncharacterized protein n=1 Tax=Fuerstiella marisgermanici TaxID=1891926 RepID=A0A1P8WKC6_9PLAN|nr:hypothetical protein Fuma_04146 [Fuerstiella marisgermanici]